MDYKEMLEEVRDNHASHWGGSFQEMKDSDKRIAELEKQYPELSAQALADYNEMLRKM